MMTCINSFSPYIWARGLILDKGYYTSVCHSTGNKANIIYTAWLYLSLITMFITGGLGSWVGPRLGRAQGVRDTVRRWIALGWGDLDGTQAFFGRVLEHVLMAEHQG